MVRADLVKKYIGRTNSLIEEVIFENRPARAALGAARPVYEYMAVAVDNFGVKNLAPAPGLVAVGDAAAFIDPFTGSGMLMALESAALLAESIAASGNTERVAADYRSRHADRFAARLRVCGLLRRAAFWPALAGSVIAALSLSRPARRLLARSTRRAAGGTAPH